MNRAQLVARIKESASFLCVGLDTDPLKIPEFLHQFEDPIFEFNKRIIDSTQDLCVAYKPNIAFYEALGPAGWRSLEKTLEYIPKTHFTIADAKRGDIGNTSGLYAKTFFDTYHFDSITVAPYMGRDSVSPFLEFEGKWVILLGLTSNPGSQDFQVHEFKDGDKLYEKVLKTASTWASDERIMFVVGATHPESFKHIRTLVPNHFLLVPGVGAQGGDLEGLAHYGLNEDAGLLVNSTRGIIYAGKGADFADKARDEAGKLQVRMAQLLKDKEII